jgi:leucyl-tRNA synthetase
MACPATTSATSSLAKAYGLPITIVVQRDGEPLSVETMTEAHAGEGSLVNSDSYNGLPWRTPTGVMTADAKARGIGEGTVQYRLKDWGISPPALLGHADPGRALRETRRGRGATGAAGHAAGDHDVHRPRRLAAGTGPRG